MTRLFLMRHARARPGSNQRTGELFSVGDQPLSKRGRRQAQKMGELIAREEPGIDAVHASPAKRCRETAEIVAEQLPEEHAVQEHAVQEHEDLVEIPYARPGADYEDVLGTIIDVARQLREDEDPELPTGVGWGEATGRFAETLEAILAEHERPLVVAHGAQNRAWLTELLGMPAHRLFFLEQDHACLNIVGYEDTTEGLGRPALQKLNLTPEPLATQQASFGGD